MQDCVASFSRSSITSTNNTGMSSRGPRSTGSHSDPLWGEAEASVEAHSEDSPSTGLLFPNGSSPPLAGLLISTSASQNDSLHGGVNAAMLLSASQLGLKSTTGPPSGITASSIGNINGSLAGSMDSGGIQPIPQAQAVALAELLAAQRGHLQQQHQQQMAAVMALEDEIREAAGGAGARPTCAFFKRTGTCAYGDRCKFLHPVDCPPPSLNQRGYPMRPEEPNCPHYIKKGWCAFGATCKFHHAEGHVGPPLGFNPNLGTAYLQQLQQQQFLGNMAPSSSLAGQGDGGLMMAVRGSKNPFPNNAGLNSNAGYPNLEGVQLGNSFNLMSEMPQPANNAAHLYALQQQQQQQQQFFYGNGGNASSLETLVPALMPSLGNQMGMSSGLQMGGMLGGWNGPIQAQGMQMAAQGGRAPAMSNRATNAGPSSQNLPMPIPVQAHQLNSLANHLDYQSFSNPSSSVGSAPHFDSSSEQIVNAMQQLRMGGTKVAQS